jgi:pilus assembly protein TadC
VILGALAAGIAVTLCLIASRGTSHVERRISRVATRTALCRPTVRPTGGPSTRVLGALFGATVGCVLGWALDIGVLAVPIAAYAGLIIATALRERRASAERGDADRATITLVEWLHALVASGRPIETAMTRLDAIGTGSALLDAQLAIARRDYALGVPLHQALARAGSVSRLSGLVQLADRIDRARDLGRGMLPMLQDLRDELRAAERARALEAAGRVEGKLTLVLTLCYLPALALLVVIPLFLTLLSGLFG